MLGWMRRYVGIGVAWLAATALSVAIASAAVAGIRDRVVDTPVAIGAPATTTVLRTPDVTTTAPGATTTSAAPTTATTTSTAAAPPATTTTVVESTGTTTTASPVTTTTPTAPPQTTTTVATTNQTYTLIGGTVTLTVGNGQVSIFSVFAAAGFYPEIEHDGPTEVEVKFESDNHKSELSARFENGELKVSKEEEPRGDHDD